MSASTLFVTIEPIDTTTGRAGEVSVHALQFGVYVGPQSFTKRAQYGANYRSRGAATDHAESVASDLISAGHNVHRSF